MTVRRKRVWAVRDGARLRKEDVPKVLSEIESIAPAKTGNIIRPAQLVERARPKSSPIHHLFEWDDAKAGQAYREHQARLLLGAIVIQFDDGAEVPAMVNVKIADESVYASIDHVMSDADLTKQLLADALEDMRAWKDRYHELREFAKLRGVFAEVERALN